MVSLVLGSLAVGLSAAALAFACTPQADIYMDPDTGAAGSRTTVEGIAFVPGAPVEIHWGSASGPLLATATGWKFSVPVTIPADASDGVHYIVAVGYTDATRSKVAGKASNAFMVPVPARDPGTSPPASSGDSPSGAPAPGTAQAPTGAAAPSGAPAQSGGRAPSAGRQPTPERESSSAGAGDRSPAGGRAPARSGSGGRKAPGSAGSGGRPATVRTPSGQSVFADSLPPAARTAGPEGSGPAHGKPGAKSRTGGSDVAAGAEPGAFGPEKESSLTMPDGGDPSLTEEAGLGPRIAIGAGILAFGLVALLGAFLVAEVRRRRPLESGGSLESAPERW